MQNDDDEDSDTEPHYTWADLSEEAKNHVRWHTLTPDHCWWDDVYAEAKQDGIERGFDIANIGFSGFSSQGDGANWRGLVVTDKFIEYHSDKPERTTTQEILLLLAKQQCIPAYVQITNSGRSDHSGCMGVGDLWYNTYVNERIQCDGPFDGADPDVLFEAITVDGVDPMEALGKWMLEMATDYADEIYRRLEAEYDHQTSDEYLKDLCECNDYVFNEKGELI